MLTSLAKVVISQQVYGYPLSRSGKKSSRMYYIVYDENENVGSVILELYCYCLLASVKRGLIER